jgi:hypothetical protein
MKTIINHTQIIIQMEISHILEEYPHHPHQKLFANPDRRQDLLVYVLNHINSRYTSTDVEAAHRFRNGLDDSNPTAFPAIVGSTIESLIHSGIRVILNQNTVIHEIPEVIDSSRMASSWFG